MLNEIRRLFRRSVEAFRTELSTREPEDQVSELLSAMRKELVAARAAIPEFEAEVLRVRAELGRERDMLAQCERRASLAERIGDGETVRVANEFAARHRDRVMVLEQKGAAAEAEVELRRREADEMKARYREAEANRFALLAQIRRAAADQRMRSAGSDGAFADFGRMEERVEREAGYVEALEELDGDPPASRGERGPPPGVEDRLQELKRRMGRTD